MNWSAISAIADLIAAIAVVLSLLYLAAQIRHNTRELDEQNRSYRVGSLNEVASNFSDLRGSIIDDQALASLWVRGRDDLQSLDRVERLRFDYLAVQMFWCWAMLYLYRQQDVMDERVMDLSVANLPLYASGRGIREWWRTSPHRSEYPPEFAAEIDRLFSSE